MTHDHASDMPIRQLLVDLSNGFPRHWHSDDPYRSHLYNSLSMLLPLGEQNFIDVAREFIPMLQERNASALLAGLKAFIGQEATHRRLHALYNQQLAAQGYDNRIEPLLTMRINMSKRYSPLSRLAIVAAFEHFTSVIGDGLLRNESWSDGMHEPLQTLWRWHAAEESEHKAVAFDVYRAAGGGYLRRVSWFAYATLVFFFDSLAQSMYMLRHDKTLSKPATWLSALRFWWGREGLVWHLVPQLLRYFSPGFHPWQHDNRALIEKWKQQYAADYQVVGTAPDPGDAA